MIYFNTRSSKLNYFQSFMSRIRTNANFLMFLSVLVVLLFGLMMFLKCSVTILFRVPLLCPFSAIMSIEDSVLLWRYFSVGILYSRTRKPLNTPTDTCGAIIEFGCTCIFVNNAFRKVLKSYELLLLYTLMITCTISKSLEML